MRTARSEATDPALDALEHEWWNANAATIARVWEMSPEVSWAARGHYLRAARRFFLAGRPRAKVLELGAGSGWVGQSIAGPDLHIVGTDFSEAQVDLARRRAQARGLEQYCTYRLATAEQWPPEAAEADGALLHAFLHHLDGAELDAALRNLRERLRPGTRLWFYEPAFLSGPARAPAGLAWRLSHAVHRLSMLVRRGSAGLGLRDDAADAALERLARLAEENGWYLSPKEVPFDFDRFTGTLAQRFRVRRSAWATVYLVGWAHEVNLMRSAVARRLACATFLPLAALCDRLLAARAASLGTALQPPQYGFAIWECEVPA